MENSQIPASNYLGRTVLAIGAHPDDLELGIGGTLARLSKSGVRVLMVVVCVPSRLEQRLAETKSSAKILGCDSLVLYPDECKRVEDIKTYELVHRLDKLVADLDPAAMFTHAEANFHKDHILAGQASRACQRNGFFDVFAYYPTNCRPVQVPFQAQAYVDITDTIEQKMEAINTFASQFTCKGLETDHYREVASECGRYAGVPYAEGLEVVRLRLS